MNYIDDMCPLTKLEGGLQSLHNTGDDAVYWLEHVATIQHSQNEIKSENWKKNLTVLMLLGNGYSRVFVFFLHGCHKQLTQLLNSNFHTHADTTSTTTTVSSSKTPL